MRLAARSAKAKSYDTAWPVLRATECTGDDKALEAPLNILANYSKNRTSNVNDNRLNDNIASQ
jgi:hypothetical protein